MVLDDRRQLVGDPAGQMVADLRRQAVEIGSGDLQIMMICVGRRRVRRRRRPAPAAASFERFAVPRWMVSAERAEMSPRCGSFCTARAM